MQASTPPGKRMKEFSPYLNPVGYLETRYTRMMASLSAIAYRMDRLTPRYLKRMHGIDLRYTSLACELGFNGRAEEAGDEAQAMADGSLLRDVLRGED
jgi:hypothetical protein